MAVAGEDEDAGVRGVGGVKGPQADGVVHGGGGEEGGVYGGDG